MKNKMMTQVEKFNARYAKASMDVHVESEHIEQKIATELEEKKPLYKVIDLLQRSVMEMTREVQTLRQENHELRALREENAELKVTIGKILVEVQEIRKVTVGSLYMDDKKKMDLGMIFHTSPLQRHRAQQIKKQGYFEDPTDPAVLAHFGIEMEADVPEVIEEIEVVSSPKSVPSFFSNGKQGRRPSVIMEAITLIQSHTRESGRYEWRKGGTDLVFAMLRVMEWKGIDIRNSGTMQKEVEPRKVFQQVIFNFDRYGVQSWAELIAKYEEAN